MKTDLQRVKGSASAYIIFRFRTDYFSMLYLQVFPIHMMRRVGVQNCSMRREAVSHIYHIFSILDFFSLHFWVISEWLPIPYFVQKDLHVDIAAILPYKSAQLLWWIDVSIDVSRHLALWNINSSAVPQEIQFFKPV